MADCRRFLVNLSPDLIALEANAQAKTQFMNCDMSESAEEFVAAACEKWQIESSDFHKYCLIFDDTKKYLTEETKNELSTQVPSILKLNWKPDIKARNLVNLLKEKENNIVHTWLERVAHCKTLEDSTSDTVLCKEIIAIDGLKAIVNYMTFLSRSPYTPKNSIDSSGQPVDSKFQTKGHLMKAMESLINIDSNLLHSDEMRQSLPNEMINILESDTSECGNLTLSANIVSTALFVLETFSDIHLDDGVEDENDDKLWLPVTTVFNLMKFYHTTPTILIRVIQAFNSVYFMANEKVKAEMVKGYSELKISDFIYEKVVKEVDFSKGSIRYELQELQSNILNGFYGPLLKKDDKDQHTIRKRLEMMRGEIFGIEKNEIHETSDEEKVEQYEIMGCTTPEEPWKEFQDSPSGKLALYLVFYFNNRHKKELKQIIEKNGCTAKDAAGCPLIASSIDLVELLCDILAIRVEEIPVEYKRLQYRMYQHNEEAKGEFVPMFYSNQEFLGEMFSICMTHYQDTWKQMRAARFDDIKKVTNVIRHQLIGTAESALKGSKDAPLPLTLEDFKTAISKGTWSKVKDAWTEESTKQRSHHPAMTDLKAKLQPQIMDRIKEQRLAQMENGQRFYKYRRDGGGREKGKEIYCKLDASHTTLHHKDINEIDQNPEYEELLTDDCSIKITNIEGIRTGLELLKPTNDPEFGDPTGTGMPQIDDGNVFTYVSGLQELVKGAERAFAITYKKDMGPAVPFPETHSLILLAKDQSDFDVWSDGINFLLGTNLLEQKTKTKQFEAELDTLLNLDLRMNLLNPSDTFPFEEIPTVPPPPPNYNFSNFQICPDTKRVIKKEA